MTVLHGCYVGNLVRNHILESFQIWKPDTFDVLLQSAVQPKVAGRQIRRIRRLGQSGPAQLLNQSECQMGIVGRGVVKVYELAPMDSVPGSAPLISCIEAPEDVAEHMLIDSLGPLDVLIINHASAVKECEYHHFGCSQSAPWCLGSGLPLPQPFHAVDPLVRVPGVHPRLIHGYCILEYSQTLRSQPCEEITHILAALLVGLCQHGWDKCGTPFGQFQVLLQDPLDGGGCQPGLSCHSPDCDMPVLRNKAFNASDILGRPSTFGL